MVNRGVTADHDQAMAPVEPDIAAQSKLAQLGAAKDKKLELLAKRRGGNFKVNQAALKKTSKKLALMDKKLRARLRKNFEKDTPSVKPRPMKIKPQPKKKETLRLSSAAPSKTLQMRRRALGGLSKPKKPPIYGSERTDETGNKVFTCHVFDCGKTFTDASSLRKHLMTHGERQYICPVEGCGKRFLDNSKLKRH